MTRARGERRRARARRARRRRPAGARAGRRRAAAVRPRRPDPRRRRQPRRPRGRAHRAVAVLRARGGLGASGSPTRSSRGSEPRRAEWPRPRPPVPELLPPRVHFWTARRPRRVIVVAIAQVVEHLVVVQGVAGSSPVSHPIASGVDHSWSAPVAVPGRGLAQAQGPDRVDRAARTERAVSSRNSPTHASCSSRCAAGSVRGPRDRAQQLDHQLLGVGRQLLRHRCRSASPAHPRRRGTSPSSRPSGRAAAPRSPSSAPVAAVLGRVEAVDGLRRPAAAARRR